MNAKVLTQIVNGNQNDKTQEYINKLNIGYDFSLYENSNHDMVDFIKALSSDLKKVKRGDKRKIFLTERMDHNHITNYLSIQNDYVIEQYNKEKNRAYDFMIDPKNADKYGLNSKKENPQMLKKWREGATCNVSLDALEAELDFMILKHMVITDSFLHFNTI